MNKREVIGKLRDHLACIADDPMWANHSEINKETLRKTVLAIDSLHARIDYLEKALEVIADGDGDAVIIAQQTLGRS